MVIAINRYTSYLKKSHLMKIICFISLASLLLLAACGEEAGEGLNDVNVLPAKTGHKAFWTGTEMILWGGGTNTGSRLPGPLHQL